MQARYEGSTRLKTAVGVLLIGGVAAAPAMAASNAMQAYQERRAKLQAAAQAKAAEEIAAAEAKAAAEVKAAEEAKAAALQKRLEALAFNPFTAASKATETLPKPATQEEAAHRLVERVRALQKVAVARRNMLMLAAVSAERRSPNTPPPYTDPRPSDPTRPGDNVSPGPE